MQFIRINALNFSAIKLWYSKPKLEIKSAIYANSSDFPHLSIEIYGKKIHFKSFDGNPHFLPLREIFHLPENLK